jgi:putative thioredoxin
MPTEVTDFEQQVITRSYEMPVVVDFWAPWCGPCRMLGPVLEKLAGEEAGKWELAKVNTDEQADVAQRFSIMSIPAVKMFSQGKVVDEFIGALPEAQVRHWLENALPSESQPVIEEARSHLMDNPEEAVQLLNSVLEKDPNNAAARALAAQALVFEEPQRALDMLKGVDLRDPVPYQIADAVGLLAHLAHLRTQPEALGDAAGKDAYLEAAALVAQRSFEDAFDRLLSVVRSNRGLDEDGARRAMLALFTLLGEEHPLTPRYRRLLQQALF